VSMKRALMITAFLVVLPLGAAAECKEGDSTPTPRPSKSSFDPNFRNGWDQRKTIQQCDRFFYANKQGKLQDPSTRNVILTKNEDEGIRLEVRQEIQRYYITPTEPHVKFVLEVCDGSEWNAPG